MKRPLLPSALLLVALSGCGGNGGAGSDPNAEADPASGPVPETRAGDTRVKFTVRWGDRSRAMQGPSSALSATVTLKDAKPGGGDFLFTVDRLPDLPAYTETYTSTTKATTGPHRFSIRFYSKPGGKGEEVAKGSANVTIAANGTGIGDVAVTNRIKTVRVEEDQTVKEGKTVFLDFSARDANGSLVPVSRGSANWDLLKGSKVLSLTYDGQATGLKPGVATVRVRVDSLLGTADVTVPSPSTGGSADFVDGDFETPVLGWSGDWKANQDVVGTPWSGETTYGFANGNGSWGSHAHGGQQYGFIQDPGSLEQDVMGLKIGKKYRVRLWIARRNGTVGGNTGAPLDVYAGKVKILSGAEPTDDAAYREVVTDTFTAKTAKVHFKFDVQLPQHDDRSTLLDDIHLEEVR